jgi:hypothetical protein
MSEGQPKRPLGLPPFYWAKPPAKARMQRTGFVNKQQRHFYMVLTAFQLARVVAFAAVALVIIGII